MPHADLTIRREYQKLWIAQRRADYFDGKSCVHCGSTTSLELDHIDPAKKVSHRIWSWSKARREAELSKCQILCTECHRAKTALMRPKPEHGNPSKYRDGCRCNECRAGHREKMRRWRASRAA